MKKRQSKTERIDQASFQFGVILGLLIGGIVALFTLPKSGRALRLILKQDAVVTTERLRARVEQVLPADPIAQSIAEGKAAARRYRRVLESGE